jgi:hypothetical protein
MYAGGGAQISETAGFARADVTSLSLLDPPAGASRVILSEPWSPEPWDGDPIRFVYVLSDSAPAPTPGIARHRFRVELTNGELVEPVPPE